MRKTIIINFCMFLLMLIPVLGASTLLNGLVLYYDFDEPSGTNLTNLAGVNHHGTTVNAPAWVGGKLNNSLDFTPASSQRVDIISDASFSNSLDFTIAYWVNYDSLAGVVADKGYIASGCSLGGGCNPYRAGDMTAGTEVYGGYSSSGYGWKTLSNKEMTTGNWHFVVFNWNSTHLTLFKNNTKIQELLHGVGTRDTNTQPLNLGAYWADGSYTDFLDGLIDEFGYWNRSLTAQEMTNLWNEENGLAYPFSIISPAVYDVNITLFNDTDFFSEIKTGQLFNIGVNFTADSVTINNSECSWNTTAITHHYILTGENLTLDGTTQSDLIKDTHIDSVFSDSIKFQVCRNAGIRDVEITVNGTLHHTISGNIIALCSSGSHSEVNITDAFITYGGVNVSVACSTCTVTNSITLIKDTVGVLQHFERTFNNHPLDDISFNETTQLYTESEPHSYESGGSRSIFATCNATNTTGTLTVVASSVLPSAQFLEITDIAGVKTFSDGVLLEHSNLTILGECISSAGISAEEIDVYFENGTIILNVSAEVASVPETSMTLDGIFNTTLRCTDTLGNQSITNSFYTINDSTLPQIIWNFPALDNNSESNVNNIVTIDFTATDQNLFSVQIQCFNPNAVEILNFIEQNLSTDSYQILNSTNNITIIGIASCNATIKDAHTDNDISKYDIKIEKYLSESTFRVDYGNSGFNLSLYGTSDKDFQIIAFKDRYSFEPMLETIPKTTTYYLECDSTLFYRQNSEYSAHFVCGELWIDFSIDNLEKKDYEIIKLSSKRYRINIDTEKAKDLKTKSFGVLNTLESTVTWEVVIPFSAFTLDRTSTAYFVLLGLFLAIWMFGLVVAIILNQSPLGLIFGVMSLLIGFFVGIEFLLFNKWVAFVFIIVNVFLLGMAFMFGFRKK